MFYQTLEETTLTSDLSHRDYALKMLTGKKVINVHNH